MEIGGRHFMTILVQTVQSESEASNLWAVYGIHELETNMVREAKKKTDASWHADKHQVVGITNMKRYVRVGRVMVLTSRDMAHDGRRSEGMECW